VGLGASYVKPNKKKEINQAVQYQFNSIQLEVKRTLWDLENSRIESELATPYREQVNQ
jgi:hypothetical protein